jgi:tRNA pseudouridine55 synthase
MDGLLIVDKPAGPTSHDVVARMRRVLHEKSIGHTGTLDPAATGVLALLVGRATRLAQFLAASEKTYEAVIRLGVRTTTDDAQGEPVGTEYGGRWPSRDAVEAALAPFRGIFLQQPPAFSAKKVAGVRSYKLARAGTSAGDALPKPVEVATSAIALTSVHGDHVTLRVVCSAGFYVRSLARDLGNALGTGGHLAQLRRTAAGEFTLADAITLDEAERSPAEAAARVLPMNRLLTDRPDVMLTPLGVTHARQGRDLLPSDVNAGHGIPSAELVRLLDPDGNLLGLAEPGNVLGSLHPFVVLG